MKPIVYFRLGRFRTLNITVQLFDLLNEGLARFRLRITLPNLFRQLVFI